MEMIIMQHMSFVIFSNDEEENKKNMEDFHTLVNLLIRQDQVFKVCNDGYCVMVEWDYQNAELADKVLRWLDNDGYN